MKLVKRSAAKLSAVDQATVLIKKYPNRRLYNTSSGAYVNLNDVAALIRQGEEIQVVDAKTGEDITRVALTQIIVEDAKDAPTGLPLELLRQLIMASDRAGQEFIMWYLKSAFDTYEKVQDAVQNRLKDVRSAALSPLNLVKNLLTPPAEPKAEDELEQLRRRVAELEERQQRPGGRGKNAPLRSRLGSGPELEERQQKPGGRGKIAPLRSRLGSEPGPEGSGGGVAEIAGLTDESVCPTWRAFVGQALSPANRCFTVWRE